MPKSRSFVLLLALSSTQAFGAGGLTVEHAWIRAAPPGMGMLAGYATLRNTGHVALRVTSADSSDFGSVSLHESSELDGVARMRKLASIELAAGAQTDLAPGGKHLMLMKPAHALKPGDVVRIELRPDNAPAVIVSFVVCASAPVAQTCAP